MYKKSVIGFEKDKSRQVYEEEKVYVKLRYIYDNGSMFASILYKLIIQGVMILLLRIE